jgi:pilus assembly protein Flp/PilA
MMALYEYIVSRMRSEEGATMVEYGLIVAFIAMVAVVGATALGISISGLFDGIATSL